MAQDCIPKEGCGEIAKPKDAVGRQASAASAQALQELCLGLVAILRSNGVPSILAAGLPPYSETPNTKRCLRSSQITSGPGIDSDGFALFDKERDLD